MPSENESGRKIRTLLSLNYRRSLKKLSRPATTRKRANFTNKNGMRSLPRGRSGLRRPNVCGKQPRVIFLMQLKVKPVLANLPTDVWNTAWAERYFLTEVTTGERSRKEQARDFRLFIGFLRNEIGSEERLRWTPRVSREFVDHLRSQVHEDGQRRFADRTVNRVLAHLKTFAKWVHSRRPFLDPEHAKMKGLAEEGGLELERALTPEERRRMLDAADHLPILGGRSKDRRRCRDVEFADERPPLGRGDNCRRRQHRRSARDRRFAHRPVGG